ncbi:MAG: hypothetical protein IIZ61_02355 [Lachnospiraceae bacterium]|nr:hypothetical protein [Lachnospiraceae bacterium]
MKKFVINLLKILGITYVILFIVFFFDLDGKLLYYLWEPNAVMHYDRMKRKDNTLTPYGKKDNVMPDSEVKAKKIG